MKLSAKSISELQVLLREQLDLECTETEAQDAGAAIIRFIVAKARRAQQLTHKEHDNEQV